MKVFRKEADYAVRTLLYLSLKGGSDYVSATRLAKELGLPMNFLRRICSTLIKAEILEAQKGKAGGVRFVKKPNSVTLQQLIELFDGKMKLSHCTFQKKLCPNRKTCVLRKRILGIEETISKKFAAVTIQTLIDDLAHG